MKHRKIIGLIALVMLLACLTTIPVLGQPPVCQFKGTVTLDGASVAAGTLITAELTNGTEVGSTTAYIEGGVSKYNMMVAQADSVPAEGATLKFYVVVGGVEYLGNTNTWNAGLNKDLTLAAVAGAVPDISVPTPLAFGSVTVGTSKTKTLTISNVGTAALTITNITVSGSQFSRWGALPGPIAAGGSATVDVTFSPTSAGAKSATLTITSNDPDEASVNVALSGTGVTAAANFASWLYKTFVECLID